MPASPEARRDCLEGWVSAQFRIRSVLQGLANERDTEVGLEIYDGETATPAALLHSTAAYEPGALQSTRHMEVGGRSWTLRMYALPGFAQRHGVQQGDWLVIVGVLGSFLLGWLAWLLAIGRERALTLARGMTHELRSTRDDLESTLSAIPDLLFEVDLRGVIYHARAAHPELLAAPPESFLGRRIADTMPPDAAARCLAALQQAHALGHSHGTTYQILLGDTAHWFELSVARKGVAATHRRRASSHCRVISPSARRPRRIRTSWPITTR